MSDRAIAARALSLLDLTDLAEDSSEAAVAGLCARAVAAPPGAVAAICIWPRFVAGAREHVGASLVRIATVVNFPNGGADLREVLRETDEALAAGADEIDLVLPWRSFLAGDAAAARDMVARVKARGGSKTLKVILETGEYPDLQSVKAASELAIAAGADFIKTSTGKTARSASPEAARVMLKVIEASGRPVGLKPSGGIRTLADARTYLTLADEIMGPDWAQSETFRFGASGLYDVLAAIIAGASAGEPATGAY